MTAEPQAANWLAISINTGSALLGIAGTCLMSRRYAQTFWQALVLAMTWPVLRLVRRGESPGAFDEALAKVNNDVPPRARDMVLGLTLLFWAFFLQLVAAFL